jgi:orotate phosphoribosyltransferase
MAVDRAALGERIRAVAYLEGDFLLRSGRRSRFYLDKYLFETDPEILRELGALIAEHLTAGPRPDRIAGPELGAVALAASASLASGIPFLIVRKEAKGYGTDNRLEGAAAPGDRVVLVEDVLTSGGAAIAAVEAVRAAGLECSRVIGVVDSGEGAREALAAAGLELTALFDRAALRLGEPA